MSVAGSDAPDVPSGVSLPSSYRPKKCRCCKIWSSSLSPWPLEGTVLSAWAPLVAWGRGCRDKPVAEKCKACLVVIELVLDIHVFFLCVVSEQCQYYGS